MSIKFVESFVTGSYAYGNPHRDSDVDLVVLVSKNDLDILSRLGDKIPHREDNNYVSAGGISLRFGRLNLIACTVQLYFEIWREGTKRLKKQSPVSRDEACRFFRKLRKEAGMSIPEEKPIKAKRTAEDDIPF